VNKTRKPFEIIDTFPAFQAYWSKAYSKLMDEQLDGHSKTGYFPGHEIVKVLAERTSFREIALLEEFQKCSREVLERMVETDTVI
jgi:hypothetical protein